MSKFGKKLLLESFFDVDFILYFFTPFPFPFRKLFFSDRQIRIGVENDTTIAVFFLEKSKKSEFKELNLQFLQFYNFKELKIRKRWKIKNHITK